MSGDLDADAGFGYQSHRGRVGSAALGLAVREVRARAPMSQAELARLSGVSRNAIVKIERARTDDPELLTIVQLAHGLGCGRGKPAEIEALVMSFARVFAGERTQMS